MPVLLWGPAFALNFDPIKALRCGVAPLDGDGRMPRAVIAPRGQSVPLLIEATGSGRIRSGSFALTSPQRFASLVRAHRAEAILGEALGRLPRALSASSGLSAAQICAIGGITATACILGTANFEALQGIASAGLWLTFSAAIVLRSMAAIATSAQSRPAMLSDDELPVYTVVAALYREADVVEDLVRAFDAFNYPKSKLDIKLVVERRDHETLARIVELRLPARYEVIIAPPGDPSTKPRALNIALSSARGALLVVYDAEDAPSPDQLRFAASRFAVEKNTDCLQARLAIRNPEESWLSKIFSIEYAALFELINPGLCALDLPIALGGSSNHFRVRSLINAGGWDEWNVAEDADLGIRLSRLGYRVRTLDSDTLEEAPHELGNWFRQRVRWQKGWMQTLIVHSRHPLDFVRDHGPQRAVAAATLIVGAIWSGLFWPFFAIGIIWRALAAAGGGLSLWRELSDVYTYLLALAGIWTVILPLIVLARQRRLRLSAKALALLPAYYALISAATWVATVDLALRPHYWAKTVHGRSQRQIRPAFVPARAQR